MAGRASNLLSVWAEIYDEQANMGGHGVPGILVTAGRVMNLHLLLTVPQMWTYCSYHQWGHGVSSCVWWKCVTLKRCGKKCLRGWVLATLRPHMPDFTNSLTTAAAQSFAGLDSWDLGDDDFTPRPHKPCVWRVSAVPTGSLWHHVCSQSRHSWTIIRHAASCTKTSLCNINHVRIKL